MKINIVQLDRDLPVPKHQHTHDAALDLHSTVTLDLEPHPKIYNISAGIRIELPHGHVGLVCSRSSLAAAGLVVVNQPGIIDPNYRGEIKILVMNTAQRTLRITKGDRIAQLLIVPYARAKHISDDELNETARGTSSLGSTGGSQIIEGMEWTQIQTN